MLDGRKAEHGGRLLQRHIRVACRGLAEGTLERRLTGREGAALVDTRVKNILGREDGESRKAGHVEGGQLVQGCSATCRG